MKRHVRLYTPELLHIAPAPHSTCSFAREGRVLSDHVKVARRVTDALRHMRRRVSRRFLQWLSG